MQDQQKVQNKMTLKYISNHNKSKWTNLDKRKK